MTSIDLFKLSKNDLLVKCQEIGIVKCKTKSKKEIIQLIQNTQNTENPTVSIKIDLLDCVRRLLTEYSLKELAEELNVATGTITRWFELNDIPTQYEFDILKLSKINIDYSKYSTKEKDQFFTPLDTAQKCFTIFMDTIQEYNENIENFYYIEPSAGDGAFLKVLPSENTIAMDIEPRHESVIQYDYLQWKPNEYHNCIPFHKQYIVFGNPPFGLRGHLALKFINHSYQFADYVCFILPQLFESDGKGVPRKRVKGYHLLNSVKLDSDFYEPNGNSVRINTIFQVWSKHHKNELYNVKTYLNDSVKVYSLSDGGTTSSTRNKDMIDKCDIYLPSTCFGKENMKCYTHFENLPGKKGYGAVFFKNKTQFIECAQNTEWDKIAFLSTNSAYNLRSSQIYSLFEVK